MAATGSIGLYGLAGCSSGSDSEDDPSAGDESSEQTNGSDTGSDSDSSEPEDTGPTTEELLAQTHSATDLTSVIEAFDPNEEPLVSGLEMSFTPADPDAGYAGSIIFSEYSSSGDGVLNVELDLGQVIEQRHHDNASANSPIVEEFVENVDAPEWRQNLLEEDPSISEIDWETYTDESLSYGERMIESNMWALWYVFENQRFGGISSTHNQYKAQALQGAERVAGFDTFVWDYGIPGHGLVSAIENPTRSDDGTAQQETYIVETSFAEGQQVVPWDNSQYSESGLHPAREGVDGHSDAFLGRTGHGKDEWQLEVEYSFQLGDEFIEFFRNPVSSPAYDYLDPVATAAYLAEENIDDPESGKYFELGVDSISYQPGR